MRREIGKYPRLSKAEEIALAHLIRQGDKEAKKKLVLHNQALALQRAQMKCDPRHDATLMELFQEAMVALMLAAERFKPDKKSRFSSYALKSVDRHLNKYVTRRGRFIRLPLYDTYQGKFVPRYRARYAILQRQSNPLIVGNDDDEVYSDEECGSPLRAESGSKYRRREEKIQEALAQLEEEDRYVFQSYYGYECDEKTLQELAAELNMTIGQVSNQLRNIKKHLKMWVSKNGKSERYRQ